MYLFNTSGHQLPVTRSKPYRNRRIIDAIHDLFFSGGSTSFAKRFDYLFPNSETLDGVTVYEVPVPMVALVATAVSLYSCLHASILSRVISCMLCSTSGVLVNNRSWSFQQTHIWTSIMAMSTHFDLFRRNGAVHSAPWWWTSIHRQSESAILVSSCHWLVSHGSTTTNVGVPLGAPIAELDIDDLEEWAPHNAFNKPRHQTSPL